MLDDAWAGKFKVLIVWSLDRICRDGAESALRIIRQLRERGCILVSVKESWLNGSPEIQDVLVAFAGWMAQRESASGSERAELASRGRWPRTPATALGARLALPTASRASGRATSSGTSASARAAELGWRGNPRIARLVGRWPLCPQGAQELVAAVAAWLDLTGDTGRRPWTRGDWGCRCSSSSSAVRHWSDAHRLFLRRQARMVVAWSTSARSPTFGAARAQLPDLHKQFAITHARRFSPGG